MDGQRFDELTRTMARGTSRRQALRLVGGGLAGALLAAVGRGGSAGAAPRTCDDLEARCLEAVGDACREEEEHPHMSPYPCYAEHGGGACRTWFERCPQACDPSFNAGTCESGCPNGGVCLALLNPAGRLMCRCIKL